MKRELCLCVIPVFWRWTPVSWPMPHMTASVIGGEESRFATPSSRMWGWACYPIIQVRKTNISIAFSMLINTSPCFGRISQQNIWISKIACSRTSSMTGLRPMDIPGRMTTSHSGIASSITTAAMPTSLSRRSVPTATSGLIRSLRTPTTAISR